MWILDSFSPLRFSFRFTLTISFRTELISIVDDVLKPSSSLSLLAPPCTACCSVGRRIFSSHHFLLYRDWIACASTDSFEVLSARDCSDSCLLMFPLQADGHSLRT